VHLFFDNSQWSVYAASMLMNGLHTVSGPHTKVDGECRSVGERVMKALIKHKTGAC